jgi:hypothetical protein
MIKETVLVFLVLLFTSNVFLSVKAEGKSIIVPDDYPSLTAAVGNATAGDVIYVRSGIYREPANQTLTINKTLSIIGEDANASEIFFHPAWVFQGREEWGEPIYGFAYPIEIQANEVMISGLTLTSDGGTMLVNGSQTKIIANNLNISMRFIGTNQTIENNIITKGLGLQGTNSVVSHNFLESMIRCGSVGDCLIAENTVVRSYIAIEGGGSRKIVYRNLLIDGSGISVLGCDESIVFNNTVMNCSSGIGVSAYGSFNIIHSNRIINCENGLVLTSEGNNNLFYSNSVCENRVGVYASYGFPIGNNNTFYCNNFVGNTEQVFSNSTIVDPAIDADPKEYKAYHGGVFDNGSVGNFWSDYVGTDTNHDGIGDTPYVIDATRQDRYPLMTPFNIESVTIDLPTWANIPAVKPPAFNLPKDDLPTANSTIVIAAGTTAATIIVTVGLIAYAKKRHRCSVS